jgi:hypothetical protein
MSKQPTSCTSNDRVTQTTSSTPSLRSSLPHATSVGFYLTRITDWNYHILISQCVIHPDPLLPSVEHRCTLKSGRSDCNRGMLVITAPSPRPNRGYVVRSAAYPSSRYKGQRSRKVNVSEISGFHSGVNENTSLLGF